MTEDERERGEERKLERQLDTEKKRHREGFHGATLFIPIQIETVLDIPVIDIVAIILALGHDDTQLTKPVSLTS